MFGIQSGKGWKLPLLAVIDIYIIFIITSLPGLAISPIEGRLADIFPGTSHLEIQMIYLAPNLAAIPFVFFGGALASKFDKLKLANICCLVYALCGVAFFFIDSMVLMIALSLIIGIMAGILSPVSVSIITDCFAGKERSKQFGYTGAILNLILMGSVILTGYLANINWRLPFAMYVIPIVPLFLNWSLRKFVPKQAAASADPTKAGASTPMHFTKECDIPRLVRYCLYYFFVTLFLSAISLYVPFLITKSSTAGNVTSMLFLGIFASGMILNWLLKMFKKGVFFWILCMMSLGFLLIVLTKQPVVIGAGAFLAAFFYGIAQPYCYTLVSEIATPRATPMAQSWLISMNSIGVVVSPFIIDGVADIFHRNTDKDPEIAFILSLIALVVATVFVFFYSISRRKHHTVPATAALAADEAKPAAAPAAKPTDSTSSSNTK